ncbi:hypothetical protein F0562_000405 [Nyssa sinensis]|uniref:non-specific serine/threonine protein kinase n=1 Tax=Nyssa sinensis TaxID=561372 RepID=A0A5J5C546_9ASTE|nr:hypothetical protein F0562_000405 [Nyssa sinensis]
MEQRRAPPPSTTATTTTNGGVILGKYRLGRLLGRGSFAKVYHARSLSDNTAVAVKVIDKAKTVDAAMEPRIIREVDAMRRLNNHPNILKIHEVMATKTKIYLIMELAQGGELFTKLARHGRFTEQAARRYFQQLVSALHFCHQNGVTHRDIKPQNLLLDQAGNLKISDFGLSALPEQLQNGLLHTACGTPAYTAPEVFRRQGYDGGKADAWSCGVILFVFLAGTLPFDDSNIPSMYQKIRRREFQFPSWISKPAKYIISQLLDPNPNTRMSIEALMGRPWFKKSLDMESQLHSLDSDSVSAKDCKYRPIMNAFDIISMSSGLDLSGLFEAPVKKKEKRFTSKASVEVIEDRLVEVGGKLGFVAEKGKDGNVGLVNGKYPGPMRERPALEPSNINLKTLSKNKGTMRIKPTYFSSLLLFFLHYHDRLHLSQAQESHTTGYTCTPNQTTYPCQTYAFYRAMAPDFLDLASIGDLFSVSRRMISDASNISSPTSPLIPNQSLFVPLTCSCNSLNSSFSISSANLYYTIKSGDTFYSISTHHFQNLTTYQSVEVLNPTLIPTKLTVGTNVIFPIFCKCPNITQLQNQTNYLISYVFQPSDTLPSIASRFGSTTQSIININGKNVNPFDIVFVPVSRLPLLTQPFVAPSPAMRSERRGLVIGLATGLGVCGLLLILTGGLWGYREALLKKRRGTDGDQERHQLGEGGKVVLKEVDANLMADVSGCLDKYRVHGIEELREATDGFDQSYVIQGSVYKGCIDGEFYAIKKMKWNASEELKILQKVNHGNLVKLEGFCIDPQDANCYLVYEYVENGSLHSWLHGNKKANLNWKTRLRIAIDIANGLQYIHEHTRPQVVHKDITSSNILLDATMRAKIANFGLAKSGCNAITMHIVGTQGYIAPEYVADGVVSTKMDVFSFGVVLLELVSGREAIDDKGKLLWTSVNGVLDGRVEKNEKRVKSWMDDVLHEEKCSIESVMIVMAVAIACLHRSPSKRPSMVDMVYALCKSDNLFFDISEIGLSPRQVIAR